MPEKTIDDIKADMGNAVVGAVNTYAEDLAKIREAAEKVSYAAEKVPDFVHDPETRRRLIAEAVRSDEQTALDKARTRAETALKHYPEEVAAKRKALEETLFDVQDLGAYTNNDLIVRVALASEDELSTLLSAATQTNNTELARAVFAEAERREKASPENATYSNLKRWVAEEFGGPFAEWLDTPTEEEVGRTVATQRFMVEQNLRPDGPLFAKSPAVQNESSEPAQLDMVG